jgi:hypothetical protein
MYIIFTLTPILSIECLLLPKNNNMTKHQFGITTNTLRANRGTWYFYISLIVVCILLTSFDNLAGVACHSIKMLVPKSNNQRQDPVTLVTQ